MSQVARDSVENIFDALKTRSEENQKRAAISLRQNIEAAHRELPPAQFAGYYNEVTHRISTLVVSGTDTHERVGGILALDSLIDFKGDDAGQKTTRFASYLRAVLRSNDTYAMTKAAVALGKLAAPGGTLTAELVEAEVKSCLEYLEVERNENRRFAAVLVLRQLADKSPTLLYTWVPDILRVIWTAVRDPKIRIREDAAQAMSSSFQIITHRDMASKNAIFTRVYAEIKAGVNMNTAESVHGSILVLQQLVHRGGMFMHGERYREACAIVQRNLEHKDQHVRRVCIKTVPILAEYSPQDFVQLYLHQFMMHLQGQLRTGSKAVDREARDASFIAIGKIANAVGSPINPYLDTILLYIREGLGIKARNKTVDESSIFECLSMISAAVGQTLSKYMEALLDPIFACGLSEALTQALVDMAYHVPPCKPLIQEHLLDLLSETLCGRPFLPLGNPYQATRPAQIWTRDHKDPAVIEHKEAELCLALGTLGSFDFSGYILNEFVRDVAIKYVDAENPSIRKAAALTCCQLYCKDPILKQTSAHAIKVVGDVIEKLLTVAVSDVDPDIRLHVLQALDKRFDAHLGKAENTRTLFLAVNDEVFANREQAISIIGRLTDVNPAYVFPSLRKVLVQLLTAVQSSDKPQQKDESAKLVSRLVSSASQLIQPYVQPIVQTLLPKARDSNTEVASTTLRAIGDLALVGGRSMTEWIPPLMEIIVENLQDLSSDSKRMAALQTLGKLATNAGYVIDPYKEHPELLTILMNIIKTDQPSDLRKETVRLMGVLGALDPDEHQKITAQSPDYNSNQEASTVTDVSLIMSGLTPSNEEYYPTVVIHTLMALLKDNSFDQYHSAVIDAVMNIYATLGLKCVGFLGQVVPGFLTVIRGAPAGRLESYFNQLGTLVRIVKNHIRPHLGSILDTVKEFWTTSTQLQATMLSLIEAIARSLEGEFKTYLADVLPLMLGVFDQDTSPRRLPSERVLHAFLIFGSNAEEYMHLIIPVIVRMFDKMNQPTHLRKQAIETIGRLSRQVNISEFASKIIHPISRVLAGHDSALKQSALDTLCALIFQLGPDYIHFVPTINKILTTHRVPHHNYSVIVSKLQKGEPLPQDLSPDEQYGDDDEEGVVTEIQTKKSIVNQQHLKSAWETSQKSTRDDWVEWMRRFSVELLRESPQQALRACTPLATVYPPIARALFNSAFVSCWTELYDQYQVELVDSLQAAITSSEIPPEILQVLLNLAEFMEHDDKALPIDVRVLGMYAFKCHAFAKALHYKELEFTADQNSSAVDALISINNHLQQTDAAFGILRKAQHYQDVELKETWYEKLQRWDDALEAYNRREEIEPNSFEVTRGKMRCFHALGDWDQLSAIAQDRWTHATLDQRRNMAPLAAAAAWGLKKWELMEDYLSVMRENSPDRSFFAAILQIHRNHFTAAHEHIEKAREGLNTELGALLGESYARAYFQILRVQMLAELEEIIVYKQNSQHPEKLASMRQTWAKRLRGCQPNPEVWQRMLKVRALVITPQEDMSMVIKFSNLCRKNGRTGLAAKNLSSLLEIPQNQDLISYVHENSRRIPYPVCYAVYKFMWSQNRREAALASLKEFTAHVTDDLQIRARDASVSQMTNGVKNLHAVNGVNGSAMLNGSLPGPSQTETSNDQEDLHRLLAKCYLKQGEWQTSVQRSDWTHDDVHEVLAAYRAATHYNQNSYKAWHAWALANFEVITAMTSRANRDSVEVSASTVHDHIVPAVRGFFKSISLSSSSSLQDALRLLTLWFAHGHHPDVNLAIVEGINTVNVDTWLEVIPQLLARINQPQPRVRQSIHNLLSEVGRAHPQALVFPLTVSMKSDLTRRSRPATQLMDTMRQHSPKLVEQADLVMHELIRIAVLWHEQWHEGLEEASRLYFGDKDIEGMFSTLEPLHKMLDNGPETLREISFIQSFGRELQEARDWCQTFRSTGEVADLNQAWDLYYQVFRKIARQLPSLMTLELQYVSPRLKNVDELDLAVPGTYQPGKPLIRIVKFNPVATVIQSKQRPRKLVMQGSDGNSHMYLVKGHEDIRQDERVMQLFGLINTLLVNDTECRKRHLSIQKYSATPLSTSSGLIGWVPNSDTLHMLIREYRESRKILLNIEHRIMLQMAPDYDNLTLMQKVEVFGYALDNTTGQDLYRVLWLKSKSSEAWLERRTNYTRSLAVMSMVGYILGLGDRHPSNLMLDRGNGMIIHIDFGDCFEVAMHRDKYPERVPLRLTRMLTYAMEVSNIEGSYRTTCENVMQVLRDNKESVMAVLEAFIHDPLLTWRLGQRESPPEPSFPSERRASIIGPETGGAHPTVASSRPDSSYRPRGRSGTVNQYNEQEAREVQNQRALQVLARVKEKLTGRDFKPNEELEVDTQVDKLISQATNLENLCQHYIGWCSFW